MKLTHELSQKISILIKRSGRTQAEVADALQMPQSQLSKFLNGHAEIKSENFLKLLLELDVDVCGLVSERIDRQSKMQTQPMSETGDAVQYLLSRLDKFGRENVMNHLLWIVKTSQRQVAPENVIKVVREQIRAI